MRTNSFFGVDESSNRFQENLFFLSRKAIKVRRPSCHQPAFDVTQVTFVDTAQLTAATYIGEWGYQIATRHHDYSQWTRGWQSSNNK